MNDEPRATEPKPEYKYWAFISYSHQDRKWGEWLHRSLEAYRTPRNLIGRASRDGTIPSRLFPIFRDREELPVSSDLGANLKNSLLRSRYLIVICSPAAARSLWVGEEIRFFKTRYGDDRMLCLIVAGEPNSSDKAGSTSEECFPAAVRFRVLPNGELSADRTEPIAADARPFADGLQRAKIKLLAGLLGVNFDDLWRREGRRRIRRALQTAALVVFVILTGVVLRQWEERRLEIAGDIEKGSLILKEGMRLQAAPYFVKAWEKGGRGEALREGLRDSAKALIEPIAILKGENWITFASFLDDSHVVTAGWDKKVRLWDLATLQGNQIAKEPDKISCANPSADGRRMVIGVWNGLVDIRTRDGQSIATYNHGGKRVNWAVYSPDELHVITAGDDGLTRIWNAADAKANPVVIAGHDSFVKTAVFSPDGKWIVTASFDTTAKVWDAATGRRLFSLVPQPAGVNSAAFSPDGSRIATGCLDGSVLLWDANPNEKSRIKTPQILGTHAGKRVNSVAFSPDSKRLLSTSDDRTAKIWDIATGDLLLSLEAHHDIVIHGAFSADGRRAVTASKDQTAIVFDAEPKSRTPEEIIALSRKFAPEPLSSRPAP
jgi:WD40 repeat protein